jgi:hypothetical protein
MTKGCTRIVHFILPSAACSALALGMRTVYLPRPPSPSRVRKMQRQAVINACVTPLVKEPAREYSSSINTCFLP